MLARCCRVLLERRTATGLLIEVYFVSDTGCREGLNFNYPAIPIHRIQIIEL